LLELELTGLDQIEAISTYICQAQTLQRLSLSNNRLGFIGFCDKYPPPAGTTVPSADATAAH
jgi:hypothetical protein